MAKGNLVQGMGRGKLGDIVFYRLDGQQIARVRNRNPHNPRTNKQLYQRAIMSTIMRAYSVGKVIFDHSFEGQIVGRGCQRHFMTRNAKLLRSALAADLTNQPANQINALVVGPDVITPVPNLYYVSEGSLNQTLFGIQEATAESTDALVTLPNPAEGVTIADYMTVNGIKIGDIYTFVFFTYANGGEPVYSVSDVDDYGAHQLKSSFGFLRLMVKTPTDATASAATATIGDIFRVDDSANVATAPIITQSLASFSMAANAIVTLEDAIQSVATFAIIKSDELQSLRSTETMHWATFARPYGLNWQFALQAWKQGPVQVGDSDLILDGADF